MAYRAFWSQAATQDLFRSCGSCSAKTFKIKRALFSVWHPLTDVQTERVHRIIEQVFRTYIQSDVPALEDLLPAAELAYN